MKIREPNQASETKIMADTPVAWHPSRQPWSRLIYKAFGKKMKYLIAFLASATLLLATPQTSQELYGGSDNISIIKDADRVLVCALHYPSLADSDNHFLNNRDYTQGPFGAVPASIQRKLISALLADSTYGWDYMKPCYPIWHNMLRFEKGMDVIEIKFCFDCYILSIEKNGKPVAFEDFEGKIFLNAMKELFPDDKALKSLK